MEMSLRESEEKFRLLVENSNDLIYTLSSTGIIEFISPVCKTLLGHEVAEIEGKSIGDFVHPDDILSFFSFFNSVMATGNSGSGIEYRMRHKNGSWVWHSSSGVPFRDEAGMILGFYGISRDVSEQKRLEDELHLQATTDELTGTHNRRDFISIATLEIRRALRLAHPLSLALIDLDEFKLMNDSWGHAAGDRALVLFANICQENIRAIDILSRVGGDEFTVLMPETDIDQAHEILSRVRRAVASERFSVDDHETSFTVSIGVSTLRGADDHLDSLLSRADKALYLSKTGGRNHVTLER
jgi:diguanylate cyclase (GGDEF)-like protein/PAS domain S-box-containing protein